EVGGGVRGGGGRVGVRGRGPPAGADDGRCGGAGRAGGRGVARVPHREGRGVGRAGAGAVGGSRGAGAGSGGEHRGPGPGRPRRAHATARPPRGAATGRGAGRRPAEEGGNCWVARAGAPLVRVSFVAQASHTVPVATQVWRPGPQDKSLTGGPSVPPGPLTSRPWRRRAWPRPPSSSPCSTTRRCRPPAGSGTSGSRRAPTRPRPAPAPAHP